MFLAIFGSVVAQEQNKQCVDLSGARGRSLILMKHHFGQFWKMLAIFESSYRPNLQQCN